MYSSNLSSPIYNRSRPPPGFEGVRLAIPPGYTSAKMIPPEISAKAQSLLGRRAAEKLPFNYNESHTIIENGEPVEYLLLINMHFDNHPVMRKKPKHPPYWHPGVSVFKGIAPENIEEDLEDEELETTEEDLEQEQKEPKENEKPMAKNIPSSPIKDEDLTITDDDLSRIKLKDLEANDNNSIQKTSTPDDEIDVYKLSKIVDLYVSLIDRSN